MTNAWYRGINLGKFVTIKDVRDSLLPTFSNYSINIANQPGERFVRNEVGIRKIDIDIEILADSHWELENKINNLISVIYSPTPQELQIRNGYRRYMAILDGTTNMENIVRDKAMTLSFIAHDPISYGALKNINVKNNTIVRNSGTHETRGHMTFIATSTTAVIELNGGGPHDYISLNKLTPGQEVFIDTINEIVIINKSQRFIDPLGDFFSFPSGIFSLKLTGVSNMKLSYYERWL